MMIRSAALSDLPQVTALLLGASRSRAAEEPTLWSVADDAGAKVEATTRSGIEGGNAWMKELWFVAEEGGRLMGVARAMMLPVPPIYAAALGPPGLILDDCALAEGASPGTAESLLQAVEDGLRDLGAKVLLASCSAGSEWRPALASRGYDPITLYMGKSGFREVPLPDGVRLAIPEDVPEIVALSAENRAVLGRLHPFWMPHAQADERFANWMGKSLTLRDREMFVSEGPEGLRGYAIAQPVSGLLVPPSHEAQVIGVIDDFFDKGFSGVNVERDEGRAAGHLLSAAESSFAHQGLKATLIVCPAAWASKIALLERHGYRTAKLWMVKA